MSEEYQTRPSTQADGDPMVWFAVLGRARQTGDRELESVARREMERLGYRVTLRRKTRKGEPHE
jgi:hypothetical protein